MSVLPSKKLVFSIRSFAKSKKKEYRETGRKKNLIRKISVLSLAAFLLTVVPLLAQEEDYAPFEIFVGYNVLHLVGARRAGIDVNVNGWSVEFAHNINSTYGIKAEVSGYYHSRDVSGFTVKDSIHSFMAGPKFSTQLSERAKLFEHALVGFVKDSWSVRDAAFSDYDNYFTTGLGGGIDWKITDNFAIRAPQFDYLLFYGNSSTGNSSWTSNIRVSTGIVFQLGK